MGPKGRKLRQAIIFDLIACDLPGDFARADSAGCANDRLLAGNSFCPLGNSSNQPNNVIGGTQLAAEVGRKIPQESAQIWSMRGMSSLR